MTRLTFAPDLVEEAVLLSERAAMPDARAFRRERDRIYQIADDREREARFRDLHFRHFSALGLGSVVTETIEARSDVAGRVDVCRVVRAVTKKDEGADLVDEVVPGRGVRGGPILVVRLRPTTLVEPAQALAALLHHELTHVADMLNPAFGYQRELPPSDDGPSADTMQQNRYRVLWNTTIDGRLVRAGLQRAAARDARWRDFALTFGMLGDECPRAFERWFSEQEPTHAGILAFAISPTGFVDAPDPGRCPLCRFPTASLDPRVHTLADDVVDTIRSDRPEWARAQGICPQCLDLYEARHEERHAVAG
jgi:hypothetical protein